MLYRRLPFDDVSIQQQLRKIAIAEFKFPDEVETPSWVHRSSSSDNRSYQGNHQSILEVYEVITS